jgi:hypothetical protein
VRSSSHPLSTVSSSASIRPSQSPLSLMLQRIEPWIQYVVLVFLVFVPRACSLSNL